MRIFCLKTKHARRWSISVLTLVLVAVFVGYKIIVSLSLQRELFNSLTPNDIHAAYLNSDPKEYFKTVAKNYIDRLSKLKQPLYNDSKFYVNTGPPIASQVQSELSKKNVKKILLWTKFYGNEKWIEESKCPGHKYSCVISTDKKDLLLSDALLMHPFDLEYLPPKRLASQRWIYFVQEPPILIGDVGKYNRVINWTYTYRLDSDILAWYITPAVPLKTPLSSAEYRHLFSDILLKKKKLVAAAISNCHYTDTNRLEFIQDLKKYVTVDFYGHCGDLKCAKGSNCTDLFSEYKFFISFENSNCRDYITEKPLNPLTRFNSVPIVMGGTHPSDYVRRLPLDSFIHYQGFASVKQIAEYITFLDENDDMYERYHRWRQTHEFPAGGLWCDMCRALHNTSLPAKVYTDFEGWYAQDKCSLVRNPITEIVSNFNPLAVVGSLIIIVGLIVVCLMSHKAAIFSRIIS